MLVSAFFLKFLLYYYFYILSFIVYPTSIFILFFCRDGKFLLSSHIISQHITWFSLVRSEVVYCMFISIAHVPLEEEGREGYCSSIIAVGIIIYRVSFTSWDKGGRGMARNVLEKGKGSKKKKSEAI